jgi:hypothetical protein
MNALDQSVASVIRENPEAALAFIKQLLGERDAARTAARGLFWSWLPDYYTEKQLEPLLQLFPWLRLREENDADDPQG